MKRAILFLEPKGTVLEVVRAAKKRGLCVVAMVSDQGLLDSAPEPYRTAVSLIDEIIPVSGWSDIDSVMIAAEALAAKYQLVGVYTGVDPCGVAAATLRQKLGLRTPTAEAMKVILNKFLLRQRLRECGLSNLQNYLGQDADKWSEWQFGKASAYFKPVHGFFSAYVQKCASVADLGAARAEWIKGVANETPFVRDYLLTANEYHLEEAIEGELLSVEGMSSGGKFTSLGLLSRILYSRNPIVEMGSCFPYPHPLADQIVKLVASAHQELGFTDGPTHTEVIVSPSGEIEIIDLNPRFVGADVLQSINHAYGIAVEEVLLDFALGRSERFEPVSNNYSCLQYVLPPEVSTFESIQFPRSSEVRFTTSFLRPGTNLSSHERQLDYLGCYLTVMPTFDQAVARSRELRAEVMVNGAFGGSY